MISAVKKKSCLGVVVFTDNCVYMRVLYIFVLMLLKRKQQPVNLQFYNNLLVSTEHRPKVWSNNNLLVSTEHGPKFWSGL